MRRKENCEIIEAMKEAGITEEQMRDPAFLKRTNDRLKELISYLNKMELHGNYFELSKRIESIRFTLDTLIQIKTVCEAYQLVGDKT